MEAANNDKDKIDLGSIISTYSKRWWWFAISVVICLGLAFLYLRIKTPEYVVQSLIMVNQDDGESKGSLGGLGSLMASFSMGGGGDDNIYDEIIRIQSHTLVLRTIKGLDYNKVYWTKPNLLSRKEWYYKDSPIKVSLPQSVMDTISVSTTFKLEIPSDGKNISLKVKQGKAGTIIKKTIPGLPYTVATPYGHFYIEPTGFLKKGEEMSINALVMPYEEVIENLKDIFNVTQLEKKSNAIGLYIEVGVVERGKDFLNMLVAAYNEQGLSDKNEDAANSVQFIEDRLIKLYHELETSETKIENYKKDNRIVDAEAEAEYIFKKKETIENSMIEYETKSAVLKMIRDFLSSPENKYNLVPFTADFPETALQAYNELVLQYINLKSTAKAGNATLRSMQTQIDAMRQNVISTIDKQLQSTRIALVDMQREAASSENRMTGIPTMERELKALYRDQIIKNEIYGFLLQKREEAQMKLSRTTPKGKIIDTAYNDIKPVRPKKILVLFIALLMGLIAPIALKFFIDKAKSVTNRKKRRGIAAHRLPKLMNIVIRKSKLAANIFFIAFWIASVIPFILEETMGVAGYKAVSIPLLFVDFLIGGLGLWLIRSKTDFAILLSFLTLSVISSIIYNDCSLLSYINGIRYYFGFLFVIPVFRYFFGDKERCAVFVKRMDKTLYIFLWLQVPCMIIQCILYGAFDNVGGSLGWMMSGLISTLIYIISFYFMIKRWDDSKPYFANLWANKQLIMLLLLSFLNETKISFIWLGAYFFFLIPMNQKFIKRLIYILPLLCGVLFGAGYLYMNVVDTNNQIVFSQEYLEKYLIGDDQLFEVVEYAFENDVTEVNESDYARGLKWWITPQILERMPHGLQLGAGVGLYKGNSSNVVEKQSFAKDYFWLLQGTIMQALLVMTELGVIGIVLYFIYWLVLFRVFKRTDRNKQLSIYMFFIIMIMSFYSSPYMSVPFYIIFGYMAFVSSRWSACMQNDNGANEQNEIVE